MLHLTSAIMHLSELQEHLTGRMLSSKSKPHDTINDATRPTLKKYQAVASCPWLRQFHDKMSSWNQGTKIKKKTTTLYYMQSSSFGTYLPIMSICSMCKKQRNETRVATSLWPFWDWPGVLALFRQKNLTLRSVLPLAMFDGWLGFTIFELRPSNARHNTPWCLPCPDHLSLSMGWKIWSSIACN